MNETKNNDKNVESNKSKLPATVKMNSVITVMFIAIIVLVLGMISISKSHFRTKNSNNKNFISTDGEAEREVEADTAEWSIYFERVGEKQSELAKTLSEEKPLAIDFFVKKGIEREDIEVSNYINKNWNKDKENKDVSYRMGYCVYIKTKKIDLAIKLKNNLSELYKQDLGIIRNTLDVSYSKQKETEQELYKEATKNAINKAFDLAKSIKIELGGIQKINVPMFHTKALIPNSNPHHQHRTMMASPNNGGGHINSKTKKRIIKANINLEIGIK